MIRVVGLGPAGLDYVLPVAREALNQAQPRRRFLRTARHPAADQLDLAGSGWETFDSIYEHADSLDEAYAAIVERLIADAESGDVTYAVPGSPVVAERTVSDLAARYDGDIHIVPGMSFADLAWTRVMVDPMQGANVLDGHTLDEAALLAQGGPTLIAQVDSQSVLDDVVSMLSLLLDDDADVTILSRLGLPDELVRTVPLGDVSARCEPDHLTSLFVRLEPTPDERFGDLVALTHRLRGPGGCPWDAAQTHQSLTRYLLEESYEVLEAIAGLAVPSPPIPPWSADYEGDGQPFLVDFDAYGPLQSELGDVLFQVLFHAELASEAGAFSIGDVIDGLSNKLVRRHPHVFGDAIRHDSASVEAQWEQIKKQERSAEVASESVMDGIPANLPALLTAAKVVRKAAAVGDPLAGSPSGAVADVLDKLLMVQSEGAQSGDAQSGGHQSEGHQSEGHQSGGDPADLIAAALVDIVGWGRSHDVDSETALMHALRRTQERVRAFEAFALERGVDVSQPGDDRVRAWAEFNES